MTTINPSVLQARQFAGGIGTQVDPYQVATASQLDSVRYFASAHFRQTADIDLGVNPYNIGHGWKPIPNFRGSYDGDGYTISNLYISRAATDTVGLFAKINGASITNLTLLNPSVNGNDVVGTLAGAFSTNATMVSRVRVTGGSMWGNSYLGGLVGSNEGVISESAATGMSINGTQGVVGGLAGSTSGSGSSISNSYAMNALSGALPGGLVGTLSGGMITNSYTASSGGQGLVNDHSGGSITTSFYNADSSLALTTNGTPLFTETMHQQASFFSWDFSSIWVIVDEGKTFPELRTFADLSRLFENGSGSKADPYQVKTDTELNRVRLFPSAHYKQTADISLKAYQSGKGWFPIPDFTGSYDGGGYTISGLVIDRPNTDMVGLFADVTGASLSNLTLSGPSVTGRSHVGTLAGQVNSATGKTSTVSKIRVTGGSLKGTSSLGGLVGSNQGAISLSAATGITIDGSGSVIGGLTGRTSGSGSSISNSYAINKLNGGRRLGALSSILSGGTITNSYSASSGATGLVNANYSGTITNSYFNSDSSATNSYGDSLTTARMSIHTSFAGFDFNSTWYFDPADPAGFPLLRELTLTSTPAFSGGSGTQGNPYLVATAADVANISLVPGGHYKQTADIDLGVAPYHTGLGWRPIHDLTGSYDGDGYAISNLVINRPASDTLGLFAKITGATVTKLSLSNPSVIGKNVIGALAGAINSSNSVTGTVSQVQITGGSVSGTERLGGLAGVSQGAISQSAATRMSVNGGGWVIGGLVGITTGPGSSISNSYAINRMSSSVTGSSPGGLIGFSSSTTITNSYASSSGSEGVVASNGGTITNSYFNSDSSTSSGNGDSLSTALMSLYASFAGFDFSNTWYFDPADPDGFPLLRKLTLTSTPVFSGGSGTHANPYLVATAADVANISLLSGSHFKQTADINLGVAPYNTGSGWRSIPDFKGSYDGGGYTISGLVIERPYADNAGLFGEVKGAKISDLSLNGATVKGRKNVGVLAGLVTDKSSITSVHLNNLAVVGSDNTGGLAGQLASGSTLSESYTIKGSITGLGTSTTGGLVGFANNATITSSSSSRVKITSGNNLGGLVGVARTASISNCYAINRVTGSFAGGLVGVSLDGSITNCYSAGKAEGGSASGIVGSNIRTIYSNIYFNSDSTTSSNNFGTALKTEQMHQPGSFIGFDFATKWTLPVEGVSFPELRFIFISTTGITVGSGTLSDPYQIATADQLNNIRLVPTAHYLQTADIDLGVAPYNTGKGWLPIPGFSGTYDGKGHRISNLFINRGSANNVGLFGSLNGGRVENLVLNNPSVTGQDYVGALVGFTGTTKVSISRLRITGGSVNGSNFIGGMVGRGGGAITHSYATGMSVTGSVAVGGLVGIGSGINNSIANSYAINTVQGSNSVGGLVAISNTVTNSYSASKVTSIYSGPEGLVSTSGGSITNSYYNTDSTAVGLGNGTALTTAQMYQDSSFTGFDFDTTWVILDAFPELRVFADYSVLFAGGSGTQADPYKIGTARQLYNIRQLPSRYYRQTADINLGVAPYKGGEGWLPIPRLTGSYDGGGYTISNLFINRPASDTLGLFATVTGATLTRLTLSNPSVTGRNVVGALAGVFNSATTKVNRIRIIGGSVNGGKNLGGLVGSNKGAISLSVAIGMSVSGSGSIIGGLAGSVSGSGGSISNSYAINKLNSSTTGGFPGGLVGSLSGGAVTNSFSASSGGQGLVNTKRGGSITNSYFNSDSSSVNSNGTPLSTAKMSNRSSFDGFDFDTTWVILNEGRSFPELQAFADYSVLFAGGTGTEFDPYRITTAGQLYNVRLFPSRHYRQTSDIDLNVSPYNDGGGWLPILRFTGSYDGDGFTISNLTMNQASLTEVGLFGKLDGGFLTDLTIRNPSISGGTYTGTLVGSASSNCAISRIRISGGIISSSGVGIGGLAGTSISCTVSNIQVSNVTIASRASTNVGGVLGAAINTMISRATVNNSALGGGEGSDVGGLAGELSDGSSVSESAVTGGNIENGDHSGGLAGRMFSSSITNSYSNTAVSGMVASGGLVGTLSGGSINTSYSASKATGNNTAGLVSNNNRGTITNSFYNSDSTSTGTDNGFALTTAQMYQQASFNDFDFATVWFIDEGSRFPGFQERKEDELVLTGGEGWRMLTSPLHSHSIGRLFKNLWLQGFKGADQETGPSNLYVWEEAKQRWEVPADTGYTPGGGKGFLIYVYNDDNADGIPEGFPKRLEYSGSGFSGDHSIDLTYTNTGSRDSVGFNLVGNPYPTTIHWDAQGWTRTKMDNVVYVWSESAGSYLAWNGLTGGLKEGKIAPWQAFWVRATGTNPRITFSDAVKSAGGSLFKQASQPVQQFPQLALELEGNGLSSTSIVMFHEQAELSKDPLDAYKLNSLNQDNYLLLGTSVDGQSAMDIQALPYAEGPSELELVIEGSNLNGEFSLSWAPAHLPEGWAAELVDTKTGEVFSMADTASYSFRLNEANAASKEKETSKEIGPPVSPITPVIKSKKGPSRFVIRFHLATSAETDPELPQSVALHQNYPNPFNPATTINYQLPEQSRVRLEVFDMLGRKVATLVDNEQKTAGHYSLRFDARNLASGMYIYRLQAGDKTITKKLTLIK